MHVLRRRWGGSGRVSVGPMMVFYNLEPDKPRDGYFSSWRVWGFRVGRFAASWSAR